MFGRLVPKRGQTLENPASASRTVRARRAATKVLQTRQSAVLRWLLIDLLSRCHAREVASRLQTPDLPADARTAESATGGLGTRTGTSQVFDPFNISGENAKSPAVTGLFEERLKGLEPSTFCMASRRSSQLRYSRARRAV